MIEKNSSGKQDSKNDYTATLSYKFNNIEITLDVPKGVWNPTPNGLLLGNVLSKLNFANKSILELGTGCGIHAIIMGKLNAKDLTLTEIDDETNDIAAHNLRKNNVAIPISFETSDWTNVKKSSHICGAFDTVVANPPFAKSLKKYRRYFIDTLILDAHKLVKPGGNLIFIHSSMADIPKTLNFLDQQGMKSEILEESSGPFRDYYFEDKEYLREMAAVPGAYHIFNGTYYERLIVIQATMPNNE